MSGYPGNINAAKALENLKIALERAEGKAKERIAKIAAVLEAIKDNRTFMRTQKAEKVTEACVANSEALKANPLDEEKLTALENDITFLAEKVKSMIIRMT
jgi:maltooligosyltrehalose synthase